MHRHNGTHHQMVIAQRFETEMETVHTLAHAHGEEYARDASVYLDPEDTDTHNWVRKRRDTFPVIIIEETLQQKRS